MTVSQFALPDPGDGEMLVRVVACTLCGSDLHTIGGRRQVPAPTILGHEILGRIERFGAHTPQVDFRGQPLALGDRVTWAIVANCGNCFYCDRGLPQKCERQVKYGHERLSPGREWTGGLAEYCLLTRGTALFRVDDALSDATLCPANCATATIASAWEAAGSILGRSVLIMGAGMLGITATAWAKYHGAEHLVVCDIDPKRLARAEVFGATQLATPAELTTTVRRVTGAHGMDVALELTGAPASFEIALPELRMGGRMILVGSVFPSRSVPVQLEQIVRRCLTIVGIHNYAPRHLQQALEFLVSQRALPWESLVTPWISLDELVRLDLESAQDALRIGVRP